MSPFHRNPRHPFVTKRQFLELQPASFSRVTREIPTPDWTCEIWLDCCIVEMARLWWNWQTRYFEVVVGQPVQVQVLLTAPFQILQKPQQITKNATSLRNPNK